MAIPILNELSEELKRLYIAGSPLAKGDPRLSKYIAPLRKLGEKAAVFNSLADRTEALVNGDESAGAIMEASLLLYSLRYTQGSTAITGEAKAPEYKTEPIKTLHIPYSQLSEAIEMLSKGSKEHSEIPERLYRSGDYKDPRLFPYFAKAISDSISVISNYVEENIIPALGEAMIPYLEEEFDIQGSKRQGRIFRLLHKLKGKDIIPLAEKAAAEGSAPVVSAAIAALGEDKKYEDALLAYAKDKKGEIRGSAFAALVKFNSTKGKALLFAELGKSGISHLEDALSLAKDEEIIRKTYDEVESLYADYEKNASKLAVLFRVLARSKEDAALKLLEDKILSAEKKKGINWLYGEFGLVEIYDILSRGERRHNEIYYKIASLKGADTYHVHRMHAGFTLFSAEKLFDECKNSNNLYQLCELYGIKCGEYIPDEKKTWDRRWGKVIAEKNPALYCFIYDNDQGAWKLLIEHFIKSMSKRTHYSSYSYAAEALARMFANKHPDAEKLYNMLVKAGYSQEELDKYIVR
jgi:hypothetical protein